MADRKMPMTVDGLGTSGVRTVNVNLPGNSFSSKQPKTNEESIQKPKYEKVIEGKAVMRKKPLGKKFKETFFGESFGNVIRYLVDDVLVPSAKDLIVNMFCDGIQMAVNGEVRPRSQSNNPFYKVTSRIVNYDKYYGQNVKTSQKTYSRARSIDLDDIVLQSRSDAQAILNQMCDIVDSDIGQVSIADLCEMLDVSCDFPDNNFGWTNLSTAKIKPARGGGYLLDLPAPEQLD